ncbi:putative HTH-type transcriptional regulator YttP [Sporomusa silvacetica DSM 10669]|uniref:HTH-type transcriptional regulator YttP n=1 Tax=Sporomusa silvacetica DSM 10669 TaxID=1123289 RepID=A0ABZ3IG77_9FIRM|nr:TetR family transcriptional regulator [Sporomusa silvacetica]OZC17075.1 putative HTH-type transcriptional regulator YttP [Sporomusa silvacetica DSM 10669]
MKDTKKKKIIDIATSLFTKHGFENISLKQLAMEAHVNVASISYYFGGKEPLYQLILQNHFTPALKSLQEIETINGLTATERLTQVIVRLKRQQPYLTAFWHYERFRSPINGSSIVKQYTAELYHCLFTCLSQGIFEQEFIPTLQQHHLTILLLEIIHSPFCAPGLMTESTPLVKDDYKDYSNQAFYIFIQGIKRIENCSNKQYFLG